MCSLTVHFQCPLMMCNMYNVFLLSCTVAGSGSVDSVIGLGTVIGLLLVSLSISVIINIYCFIR